MNLKPLRDRIVVRHLEAKETTKGGIIIPDTAQEKSQEGEVISVGSGKVLDDGRVVPLEVKKGDRVLFGKYSGSEVKLDGDEYLMIKEDDVLGIVSK